MTKLRSREIKREYTKLFEACAQIEHDLASISRKIDRLRKQCRHPVRALLRRHTSCADHWTTNYWSLCRNCDDVFLAKKQHPLFPSELHCACGRPQKEYFYRPQYR